VALVTGGARRLGRALAVGLATRGYDIALHYNSSASGADAVVAEIERLDVSVMPFRADLTVPSSPSKLVSDAVTAMGRLDVVVNSAAVMLRTPVGSVTPEVWDSIMDLNLRAPFLIAQQAAAHLPDGGVIVNVADLAAYETWPAYLPHGASKAALVYLTRALARVLAPKIRVNGVAPGTVLPPEDWDHAVTERLRESTPLRRWGTPDDVVQAVNYLIDARYVTGETILVDGGRHTRG
jgi:NAD(P)-dependent dehydrogenase (short-subunit alcohol dehydrogenase family)